jgi:signal transduction histidine kinase
MKMHKYIIIAIFLVFPLSIFSQDQEISANLGIFDATADWGFGLDSLPKRGKRKIPGRITIVLENGDPVYEISGNGDDIWDKSDEGFFLFTEKTGSWSITAKVDWLDRGGKNIWAKIGLMVREKSRSTNSKNYFLILRAGFDKQSDKNIQAQWRSINGDDSFHSSSLESSFQSQHQETAKGVYLRLKRDALRNMFYSEWSQDRKSWKPLHSTYLEMDETAAYGIAITNHRDNQLLARAAVSEVSLEPTAPFFTRFLSTDRYTPNSRIDVLLYGFNVQQTNINVTIQETIPNKWSPKSIGHNGRLEDNVIKWNLNLPPGETSIKYTLQVPPIPSKTVTFYGNNNTNPIRGTDKAVFSALEATDIVQVEFYRTMFFTTVPLVMLILHLSLFLFNPKAKENLYFALMLGFIASAEYVWNKMDFVADPKLLIPLNLIFICLIIGVLGYLEKMFKFLIYKEKKDQLDNRIIIKFIIIICCISFALSSFFGIFPNLIDMVSPYSMIVFSFAIGLIMWLRILITAIVKQLEGIWIIGLGTVILLSVVAWLGLSILSILPPLPDPKIVDFAFLLFIITLSIYLAYKFAKSNIRLEAITIELEDRVLQRTEELVAANRELHNVNEELRELDKMKTQFVSQASHDLRTPLTAIKGSLDNLLMGIAGALSEKQAKIMTRATTSVDRLTNLINDVLDLNRIETGRIILEKTDIPFKALVENIINENHPAADLKQITLKANLGEGINLHIDGSKIERVVGELISNAIKYTPESGTIDISLSTDDQHISLSVKDSGIGMTPEECTKIWERFYRTTASQKFAKGSGLGLSIAKELVELHEGTLSVVSEEGKGTIFTLTLPLHK